MTYLVSKNMKFRKHVVSICEYIKEFSTRTLDFPNMINEDLLFNFMDNLQI